MKVYECGMYFSYRINCVNVLDGKMNNMNNKTIIIISGLTLWSLGEGTGGPAFTKTIEGYLKDEWEVYLISDVVSNAKSNLLTADHNIVLNGLPFQEPHNGKNGILNLISRKLNYVYISSKYVSVCEEIIKQNNNPIVLYAYEIAGVKACARLAQKYSLPLVTRFQGTILSQYKDNLYYRIRKYPHYGALSQPADLIIMTNDGTMGDQVLKDLHNYRNVLFIRNGLDLMQDEVLSKLEAYDEAELRRNLGIKANECMFLTVSRLVNWKKVDRVIRGFAEYCNIHDNGKLVIVGMGEELEKLQQMTCNLGLNDKVIFVGAVPHDEVYNYMKACDIFLSMYDLSNVGNPLMEAMTIGKCIITLDVGDTGKVIKNGVNGRLLGIDEIWKLGKVMCDYAENELERNRLSRGARRYAEENFFSWEKRMQIELDAVNNLVRY